MAHKIGIYYDENGLRSIMKGHEIADIEQDIMMQKLSQIKAEFLQTFGFEGGFELKAVTTNSRRSRVTYRIVATDKRTGGILKSNSGWLKKFL